MAIKTFRPTTPSLRGTVLVDTRDISKNKPVKSLLKKVKYHAARNSSGRISMRHQGGQAKRMYRIIDFKRDKRNIPSKVENIQYDPNRTARIALLKYADGERRYIIAPVGLEKDMDVMSGDEAPLKVGNALPLKNIPSGMRVHNIELHIGAGAQLCRSAGIGATIMGGDKGYIQLRMPSGEIRLIPGGCYATLGEVGNLDHSNVKIGKAGRRRHMGVRPGVRGQVMAANDHTHGGGESKHRVGGVRHTIYGHRTDVKTRKNKRTNRFIIKRKTSKTRPFVRKLH